MFSFIVSKVCPRPLVKQKQAKERNEMAKTLINKHETLLEIAYIIVRLCQGHDFGFDFYDLKNLFDDSAFTASDYETLARFVFSTESQNNEKLGELINSYKMAALLRVSK